MLIKNKKYNSLKKKNFRDYKKKCKLQLIILMMKKPKKIIEMKMKYKIIIDMKKEKKRVRIKKRNIQLIMLIRKV